MPYPPKARVKPAGAKSEKERILYCNGLRGCALGFSLGAHAAGLTPTVAFDVDPILTSSFHANFPPTKLVLTDLSRIEASDIRRDAGKKIDGVFGGPPCQAFSSMGHRNIDDPRRTLLGHFFRLVAGLRPSFFVMENVIGLGFANARPVLDEALGLLPSRYKILGPLALDASDYGAATVRTASASSDGRLL
jgi:DNA (cytosine-5)-methyltransferase 1